MIETRKMLATSRFRINQSCRRVNRYRDIHVEILESSNKRPTMEHIMRVNHECIHMLNPSPRIG